MTKVNPSNENEQNQTFFHESYSKLKPYLILSKNIKVFQ